MTTLDQQLHYETLDVTARPARVAVLIDSSDVDWHDTAVRIIEFLSSVWGGQHSLIIPTDGSRIESVFWAILEKFSPDYVFFYQKTWADVKVSHPDEYASELERCIQGFPGVVSNLQREKDRVDKDLQKIPVGSFHIDRHLSSEISNRLIPFHFQANVESVTSDYTPYQLTRITDVLDCVSRPQSFVSFELPHAIDRIWWLTKTGQFSKSLSLELQNLKAPEMLETSVEVKNEDVGHFAEWITTDQLSPLSLKIREIQRGNSGLMLPDRMQMPFNISMSAVGWYGPVLVGRGWADRFTFVLGDSIGDFCLGYCLPRIGHRATWLPSSWVEAIRGDDGAVLHACVFALLYGVPYEIRRNSGPNICSVSKQNEEVLESLEVIEDRTSYGLNGDKFRPVSAELLADDPKQFLTPYCLDSPNHPQIYPFLGQRSVGHIRTAQPTGFSKLDASRHRWIAEVRLENRAIPTAPHIAEHLVIRNQSSSTYGARISRHALAYPCPGMMTLGTDMNFNVDNPKVALFDSFTAVSLIAQASKGKCRLSDKGIDQRDSLEKFGGLSEAAALFRDRSSGALLAKFLDHEPPAKGTFDEGCMLEQRRFLDFEAAKKIVEDENSAASLLDKLVQKKVLYRGFALICSVCSHANWYSLASLSDEFQCTRCGRSQVISINNWKHPAAPQIFYKLDEIVYLFLENDGDVVTLGLDYLRRTSDQPFDYSPEIKIQVESSVEDEIDLCAVYRGQFVIGEAKRQGDLASKERKVRTICAKYARVADMLSVRRVFFCTTSNEWNRRTTDIVNETFKGKLAIPVFIGREQLFSTDSGQLSVE